MPSEADLTWPKPTDLNFKIQMFIYTWWEKKRPNDEREDYEKRIDNFEMNGHQLYAASKTELTENLGSPGSQLFDDLHSESRYGFNATVWAKCPWLFKAIASLTSIASLVKVFAREEYADTITWATPGFGGFYYLLGLVAWYISFMQRAARSKLWPRWLVVRNRAFFRYLPG